MNHTVVEKSIKVGFIVRIGDAMSVCLSVCGSDYLTVFP